MVAGAAGVIERSIWDPSPDSSSLCLSVCWKPGGSLGGNIALASYFIAFPYVSVSGCVWR